MTKNEMEIALEEFEEDCCDNGHYDEAEGALKFSHMIHLISDEDYNKEIHEVIRVKMGK